MISQDNDQTLPLVIVDAANVVGSFPDQWWKDRVAANARLRAALQRFKDTGFRDSPGPVEIILVVEGQAKDLESIEGVQVESAGDGIGDDKIVDVTRQHVARKPIVITGDQELCRRVGELGAEIKGPHSVPRRVSRQGRMKFPKAKELSKSVDASSEQSAMTKMKRPVQETTQQKKRKRNTEPTADSFADMRLLPNPTPALSQPSKKRRKKNKRKSAAVSS